MEGKAKLLGHPIHPMLIVFPLGLLATAVAFDIEPRRSVKACRMLGPATWASSRISAATCFLRKILFPLKMAA